MSKTGAISIIDVNYGDFVFGSEVLQGLILKLSEIINEEKDVFAIAFGGLGFKIYLIYISEFLDIDIFEDFESFSQKYDILMNLKYQYDFLAIQHLRHIWKLFDPVWDI